LADGQLEEPPAARSGDQPDVHPEETVSEEILEGASVARVVRSRRRAVINHPA